MHLARKGRLLILIIVLLLPCNNVLGNDFFSEVYISINANIENEDYEANIQMIDSLVGSPDFEKLDCYAKGRIFHKIGVTHYLAYQEEEAIDYYKKVLQLWQSCKPVPETEVANTSYNLGICHQYLGNTEEAKLHLDIALKTFESDVDYPPYELGLKYHGVGLFYESIDDLFRAQLYFSNAINLFENVGAIAEQFEASNSAATLNMNFKVYAKASEYVNGALRLAEKYPSQVSSEELAPVYLNAATIAYEQKEIDQAEGLAKKALFVMDTISSPRFHAIGLEILGFVRMEQERFIEAEKLMRRVLTLRRKLGGGGSTSNLLALGHENLAELYLKQSDLTKANEELSLGFSLIVPDTKLNEQGVPDISRANSLDDKTLIRLLELKTKIFEKTYEKTGKVSWLQESLFIQQKIDSIIKRSLFSFQFEQSKLDFIDIRFNHYGKAIADALALYDLTKDKYYLEQSYQFSAKTKALVLQQELNRINALRSNVSKSVFNQENTLRQEMNSLQSLLFEAEDQERDSLLQSYLKAQNALDAFLVNIEKNEPDYFRERFEFLSIMSTKDLQKKLPEDLAIVEFFEAEHHIYAFWITTNDFFSSVLPLTDSLKSSILSFSEQCSDPKISISNKDSDRIFNSLLKEGLSHLKSIDRLCIVPDGSLHTISFEALKAEDTYLVESYSFSYAYASSLIHRTKQRKTTNTTQEYLGFATAYSDGLNASLVSKKRFFGEEGLTKLNLAKKEVVDGSELFDGRAFLDGEATLSNFYEHAEKARLLHLSLHGLVDVDNPERSCIVFDDSESDFLLSPPDLYKKRIQADLVLLSACHSASGKIYRGEGVQGMSKAFLLAGAQNVLSSLWNASETSSMRITQSFLSQTAKGQSFDKSLQHAKIDYIKNATPSQRHPYYWSNYILLGKVAPGPAPSFPSPTVIIAGLLALAALLFALRKYPFSSKGGKT